MMSESSVNRRRATKEKPGGNRSAGLGLGVFVACLLFADCVVGQDLPSRRRLSVQYSASSGAQTRVVLPEQTQVADVSTADADQETQPSSNRRSAAPVAKSRLRTNAVTQPPPIAEPFAIKYDAISIRRPVKPRQMRDFSWIYIDQPLPREVHVHDIITIVVDEKSEVTQDSRYTRQRMGQLKAELKEFIRLDDDLNLATAALNEPTIDSTLQSRLQSSGNAIDREGIRYRIAATVVDVLPNGHLVLEARKSIRANFDVWEYTLTGIIRSEDVNRDNTALSENIANLQIVKRSRGRVWDSVKRPWGIYLWDTLMPF